MSNRHSHPKEFYLIISLRANTDNILMCIIQKETQSIFKLIPVIKKQNKP